MLNFFKKAKKVGFKSLEKIIPETALHPKYSKLIEKSFEADGKVFWCFKNLMDMPINRYLQLGNFIEENLFKLSHENLKMLMEKQREFLNSGEITKAIEVNTEISLRLDIKFEPDLLFKLASCAYFYSNENLTEYDYDIGAEKIEIFKKQNLDNFFLRKPLSDLIPVKNISAEDIKLYSKVLNKRKTYLKERMGIEYI